MAISAEELRQKLAAAREQKARETSPERPAEASGDSSNSAQSARQGSDSAQKQKLDVRQIKQLLLERIAEVAQYLYPNGKKEGNHWRVGSIEGEPGKSFGICIAGEKAGLWGDFADSAKHSRNLLDLWMAGRKVDFKTALHEAAEWLGVPLSSKTKSKRTFPTLEEAIADQESYLKMVATRRDWYNARFVVVRFDPEKGKKVFRPFHLSNDGWIVKDPAGKLPLFNCEELRKRPAEEVYLVEGEKCVCALRDQLGLLAITSAHGAESVHKTDWAPLAGRKVVALPDADDEGERYASKAANALLNLKQPATVKIVQLPGLPPKGDCVDWLQSRNGQSPEQIKGQLEALVAATPEQAPLPKAALTHVAALKNLEDYTDNDAGNAEMFVDRFQAVVRYIHALESWFIWDDVGRWLPDSIEGVNQLARHLSDQLIADAVQVSGRRDERKLARGIEIGRRNQISNMLWLARSDPRIVIKRDQIDVDPFLLGARNGVIDLRTGKRRDGQKGDFITKSCGCAFDPAATAPRWRAFLDEIFEGQTNLIDYIQRAVGYSLTGDTREQILLFLYGGGANGKSTFIEVLIKLLGDYAFRASQNVLCLNRYAKEPLDEIATLDGYRFVSIAETGESHMAEVRIKLLTGGDTVTGKAHYKAATSFQPTFKLWIFGNSKPAVYGVDYAMWRRIKLIPFTVQFPDEKQDKTLKAKLLGELPGILNWAIEGALAWQAEGKLVPPDPVVAATNEYRDDQDILLDFITEKIERAKDHELPHKDLYAAYKAWHTAGSAEKPFSSKKIAQMFRDRGYKSSQGHSRYTSWWGIGLRKPDNGDDGD
jgi:putative DNA primase/helicase